MTSNGTAIISTAAVINGLKVVGKDIGDIKLVCSAPAPPPSPAWT